jgi:hypothetical protein
MEVFASILWPAIDCQCSKWVTSTISSPRKIPLPRGLQIRFKESLFDHERLRARVEHVFGDQKNAMRAEIVRTIGIVHAK